MEIGAQDEPFDRLGVEPVHDAANRLAFRDNEIDLSPRGVHDLPEAGEGVGRDTIGATVGHRRLLD